MFKAFTLSVLIVVLAKNSNDVHGFGISSAVRRRAKMHQMHEHQGEGDGEALPCIDKSTLQTDDIILYSRTSEQFFSPTSPVRVGVLMNDSVLPLVCYDGSHHSVLEGKGSSVDGDGDDDDDDDDDDDEMITLVLDERDGQGAPSLDDVTVGDVVEYTDVIIEARQIGGGHGLANPHGEHCEPVYKIGLGKFRELLLRQPYLRSGGGDKGGVEGGISDVLPLCLDRAV